MGSRLHVLPEGFLWVCAEDRRTCNTRIEDKYNSVVVAISGDEAKGLLLQLCRVRFNIKSFQYKKQNVLSVQIGQLPPPVQGCANDGLSLS